MLACGRLGAAVYLTRTVCVTRTTYVTRTLPLPRVPLRTRRIDVDPCSPHDRSHVHFGPVHDQVQDETRQHRDDKDSNTDD